MGVADTHRHDGARNRAASLARQTDERRQHQADALAQLDCLSSLSHDCLRRLADLAIMRTFVPGDVLIDERAPAAFLYLVLRGTICLRLHDRVGREVLIGFLNRGDCFGEGPLFGDRFRSASAQAETVCYLLQMPLDGIRRLLDESPELTAILRAIYHDRLVASTLGRVPLFGQLSPLRRTEIAEMLIARHYPRGDRIIEQGAPGDALYLVESGQVVVENNGKPIAHLDEGDLFGEMSLLTDEPHNANVRALTPTEVLILPADAFRRLLKIQPSLSEQIRIVVEQRRLANQLMRQEETRSQQLSVVLERGILRGRNVLVRDPQLCQDGCRICVEACTERHGRPRLSVGHPLINELDVTDSCRQCRVGAECAEVCPVDAIQWDERGALVITDACTGCGDCVSACPYDAVTLAPRQRLQQSPLWGLFERLKRLSNPSSVIPLEASQSAYRADKCDLCHGFEDLACVSACPTGALRLVPVEEVFRSKERAVSSSQ